MLLSSLHLFLPGRLVIIICTSFRFLLSLFAGEKMPTAMIESLYSNGGHHQHNRNTKSRPCDLQHQLSFAYEYSTFLCPKHFGKSLKIHSSVFLALEWSRLLFQVSSVMSTPPPTVKWIGLTPTIWSLSCTILCQFLLPFITTVYICVCLLLQYHLASEPTHFLPFTILT